MNVVITDHVGLLPEGWAKLGRIPNIRIFDDIVNDPKVISERIKEAEVATASYIDLTGDIIEKSPKLKYIVSTAVGYDWIDVKTATKLGIKVLNCPTFNSQSVAEHAIGLMFAVKRKIVLAHQAILKGEYPRNIVGTEVRGKLLVTIGYGNIGKKIIEMAEGLGMQVAWTNSKTSEQELDNLISRADVLITCLPLNDSTRGILNEKRLQSMKANSIVVNVARGLVIDQEALYSVLKEDKIAGAGIDTFAKDETITTAREDIMNFARLPNVVATPHIAFRTEEAAQRLGEELVADIESCLRGNPINVVN